MDTPIIAHELTFGQYANAYKQKVRCDYPGVTWREINEAYPDHVLADMWFMAICDTVRCDDVTLMPKVLDSIERDLTEYAFYRIAHDGINAIPDGYLSPVARQRQRDNDLGFSLKTGRPKRKRQPDM